jgi:hypothetical protein
MAVTIRDMEATIEEWRAEYAQLCAEMGPVGLEIADWQAMDLLTVLRLIIGQAEHSYRRCLTWDVMRFGWLVWMAGPRKRVLGEIWRGVLPCWFLWTGLAPPLVAVTVTVQRK